MRYFYIPFLFCLLAGAVFSQQKADAAENRKNTAPTAPMIRIRCAVTSVDHEPLVIVDGAVVDIASIRRMNPDDIESISILKDAAASALYGCRASTGVIIITTKSAKLKHFNVKDVLDDKAIPGATLTFISLKDQKDSLRFVADENGAVRTADLKKGEKYNVLISSVGYKTMSTIYQPETDPVIGQYRLTRDVKENQEAVVVGYGSCKRGCGRCWVTVKTSCSPELTGAQTLPVRIYPNPLQGGAAVKMEINMQNEKPLQVRVTNLSGSVLRSVAYRSFKGVNRIEVQTASQWAAGMYFMQVLDEKGKLLKQDKLIIQ